jgi:hypothetical protein
MLRTLIIAGGIIFASVGSTALYRHQRLSDVDRARPLEQAAPADGVAPQRVLSATRDPAAPPPVSASRDPRVTRDHLRGQLVQSGPATRSMSTSDGGALIRSTSKLQPGELVVGPGDCYAAGCTARVTVRRGGEFQKWQRELSHALKRQWKGGVIVTGAESQADGAAQCSLFLFNDTHL